jgi:hypothetical protein
VARAPCGVAVTLAVAVSRSTSMLVDLELRAPVGSRAVIDASAGVIRPSLAQLRSR